MWPSSWKYDMGTFQYSPLSHTLLLKYSPVGETCGGDEAGKKARPVRIRALEQGHLYQYRGPPSDQ